MISILRGDARYLPLPDSSVDLICTSPPYFQLRSYQDQGEHYSGQIGSEKTPGEYISSLLDCTREWMRVLKPEGNLFINIGDKYANDTKWDGPDRSPHISKHVKTEVMRKKQRTGLPPKSLIGLPWRYAIGCIDELGLILRAEILWEKVNGLPESVTDRVRRSHEQVFHFTKQQKYFSAIDEIREPHQAQSLARSKRNRFAPDLSQDGVNNANTLDPKASCNPLGKLPGSVWAIPTSPLKVPDWVGIDHFAAYPPELCRRIILGFSPREICEKCEQPRKPVTKITHEKGWTRRTSHDEYRHNGESVGQQVNNRQLAEITGYACFCLDDSAPATPSVVLDPFGGTGTTAMTADVLGRNAISVDMSADYCKLASWRTHDPVERAKVLKEKLSRSQLPARDQPSLFEEEYVTGS